MFCAYCQITFTELSSYEEHKKKLHPADFNKLLLHKSKNTVTLLPHKSKNTVAKCSICQKKFVKKYNLKVHLKKIHAAEHLCESKSYNYKCEVCNKQFNHIRHFKYHQKKHFQLDTNKFLKCPICRDDFQKPAIFNHFEETHAIKIETELYQFINAEEFETWKAEMERKQNSYFIKAQGSYKVKDATKSEYTCHRSGYFTSKSKGIRRMKSQGTNKINAFCPASLKVMQTNEGYEVLHVKTHIGHDNDVRRLFLTESDRVELAVKIAAKIPFDSILDEIRDSATNGQLDRLLLVTKKDLFNLEQKLTNIKKDTFDSTTIVESDTFNSTTIAENDTCDSTTIVENETFDSTTIVKTEMFESIIENISKEKESIDNAEFEEKLKEFKATIMVQLDDIKTLDQLEAVRKICAPIKPMLDAMNSTNFIQN